MRWFYILIILFLCSCVSNRKLAESELSFIGDYSDLEIESKMIFNVDIIYEGEYYSLENDRFPMLKITFNNYSVDDIVMDFPFNWYEEFINDPVLFEFSDSDDHGVKTLEFEKLSYSSVPVLLPAKKSLTIEAITDKRIFSKEVDTLSFYRLCLNYKEDQGKGKIFYCSDPISLGL